MSRRRSTPGWHVDDFGPQLAFFFAAHNHFLEEVAKFRAARRLWARIMRERFGAQDPRSWRLRFHTQTAGSTLTAQQPMNNVVRVTLQALAAVLGGTQSLHTNSMDEALALPTEQAVQVALRTQQIIAHESGVADTHRPAGRFVCRRGADRRDRGAGPGLPAADRGAGRDAGGDRDRLRPARDPGSRPTAPSAPSTTSEPSSSASTPSRWTRSSGLERLRLDPAVEQVQRQRLAALRARRDSARTVGVPRPPGECRPRLRQPDAAVHRGVEADATLGEICGRLASNLGRVSATSTV